jgi:hypothetical protein
MQEARGSSPLSSTALQGSNIERRADGSHRSRGQNEGQALGWLTSVAPQWWRGLPCCGGFGSLQEVVNLRVRTYVRSLAGSLV